MKPLASLRYRLGRLWGRFRRNWLVRIRWLLRAPEIERIDLCSGPTRAPGYFRIDLDPTVEPDLMLNLMRENLPLPDESVRYLVCMSAINYLSHVRAAAVVREVYRVLERGGVARFGVQDMRRLAELYVAGDCEFFDQCNPDGSKRFRGATIGDKFASWFYGYATYGGQHGRYMFDYESLAHLFREAGFSTVERREYRDSRLPEIEAVDNRPEQMFYLEAVK